MCLPPSYSGLPPISPPAGEVGLEVAPPSAVVNHDIVNDLANCWNEVPQATEWVPVPPK